MAGNIIGLDIGSGSLKLAVSNAGSMRLISTRMPENIVDGGRIVSPETFSDFLRQVGKENHVTVKDCSLVLPSDATYFRHINIPLMTESELKLNLPYEFRDYVTEDSGNYYYDYIVRSTDYDDEGNPMGFELYAAAVLKQTIELYTSILHRAGFKLKVALPRAIVLATLLGEYVKLNPTAVTQEFCIIEIGYQQSSIDIFTGNDHMASRVIDVGCQDIDLAIADARNVDKYVAGTYRTSDYEGALELPECESVYSRLAVEIVKVLNFYNFDNPENTLRDLYLCGMGGELPGLLDAVAQATDKQIHSADELLPQTPAVEGPISPCLLAYAAALGQ